MNKNDKLLINHINNVLYNIKNKYNEIEKLQECLYNYEYNSCDNKKEIINYIYWNFQDLNMNKVAEDLFKLNLKDFLKLIDPQKLEIKCKLCNKNMIVKSKSDKNYKLTEYKKDKKYLCKDCIKNQIPNFAEQEIIQNKIKENKIIELKKLDYCDYLETEHWKNTRKRKLYSVKFKCQICNSKSKLNVHHRTYESLGDEKMYDLTVLCRNCHKLYHFGK